MRKCTLLAFALVLGLCATAAVAVTNGDFESGTAGWSNGIAPTSNLSATAFTSLYGISAYSGSSLGIGRTGTSFSGRQANWMSQNIAVTPGTTYNVTVSGKWLAYFSDPGDGWAYSAEVALFNGAGTTNHDSSPDNWDAAHGAIVHSNRWNNDEDEQGNCGTWVDFTMTGTFTASAGFVELRLGSNDNRDLSPDDDFPSGRSELAAFDNLQVSLSQVPEPGSIVCLLSGFVGLVGFGIRRRR